MSVVKAAYRKYHVFLNIFVCIAIIWGVFLFQQIFALEIWGIQPRSVEGLKGILLSPFLHGNLNHISANTVGIVLVGGFFALVNQEKTYLRIFIILILSGLLTWIFGRPNTVHIGASGVIFGVLGYLVVLGAFEKNLKNITISIFSLWAYGGALWGMVPQEGTISWEGHVCGFIAGSATVFLTKNNSRSK